MVKWLKANIASGKVLYPQGCRRLALLRAFIYPSIKTLTWYYWEALTIKGEEIAGAEPAFTIA